MTLEEWDMVIVAFQETYFVRKNGKKLPLNSWIKWKQQAHWREQKACVNWAYALQSGKIAKGRSEGKGRESEKYVWELALGCWKSIKIFYITWKRRTLLTIMLVVILLHHPFFSLPRIQLRMKNRMIILLDDWLSRLHSPLYSKEEEGGNRIELLGQPVE